MFIHLVSEKFVVPALDKLVGRERLSAISLIKMNKHIKTFRCVRWLVQVASPLVCIVNIVESDLEGKRTTQ